MIENGIKSMTKGIKASETIVNVATEKAFVEIDRNFSKFFTEMIPTKKVSLSRKGGKIEDGIEFLIQDLHGNIVPFTELSGGQKTLLNIAFIFALSTVQKSAFYIIDELDAALDEFNQAILGKAIHKIFSGTQVLSISHNAQFQKEAQRLIMISKENERTIIKKTIDRK